MQDLPTGTVTFLFTDIEGSTRLVQEVGAEAYGRLQADHSALLREAVGSAGGVEFGTEGDAHFFVFAEAAAALLAAAGAQRALGQHPWPDGRAIRVRMGVHTGEGVRGGRDYVGVDVNRVARIAAAGNGGQVVVSASTREAVQDQLPEDVRLSDLGSHRLKDLVEPERLYQLVAPGLPVEFPPLRTIDTRPKHLPAQVSSFVGRHREIGEVVGLLESHRLLTLTGPGGTGKTRLALAAADRALPAFEDGVFFVGLAALADPELVPTTIASVLGVQEAVDRPVLESVVEHLRERRLLLVLDNLEQLLPAAPVVARLLEGAPGVRVLATSRALLHVYGEREYPVPPLGVAASGAAPEAGLAANEAVALFVERAMAARADFRLTAQNAPVVAEICRRVDALPLAIELAAARVRLLSPEAILQRLGDRLGTLTGGAADLPERQRTLRGAIEWSHDLLDTTQRRLFARLGVFAGGWDLEAAEAICGGDLGADLLDTLGALVDHSLVRRQADDAGQLRFAMLETIREFALDRLAAGREEADIRMRHLAHFLATAEAAAPALTGPDGPATVARLVMEEDNLRAALGWAIADGSPDAVQAALRLAGALWRWWQQRGVLTEARAWFDQLLALPSAEAQTLARATALSGAAGIAYWQQDRAQAGRCYDEAVALRRSLGDRAGLSRALVDAAYIPFDAGDVATARQLLEEALVIARELDLPKERADALGNLAYLTVLEERYDEALPLMEEHVALARAVGDRWVLVNAIAGLAQGLRLSGRLQEARPHYLESLALSHGAGDPFGTVMVLDPLSNLELYAGDPERAVRLWAASSVIKERIGGGPPPDLMRFHDPTDEARAALGDEAVERALQEGRAMSVDEAVAYAQQGLRVRAG